MQSSTIGNNHIFDFLLKNIVSKKLANTYIFTGPDNLGKTASAIFFAKTLLCKDFQGFFKDSCKCLSCKEININKNLHTDLHVLEKEEDKKNISIEQIRNFVTKLNMSSFANSYKIGIIKDAENLNENSSNALLKTLEEPKNKVIIILTTSNIDAILPTILSRSQIFKFNLVNQDTIYDFLVNHRGTTRDAAKNLSQMCMGKPALAIKLSEEKDFLQKHLDKIYAFINFSKGSINDRFNLIEKLIEKKLDSKKAAKEVNNIIKIWQVITRDLLLLKLNCEDLIKSNIVLKELNDIKNTVTTDKLIQLIKIFKESKKYLKANVGAKSVLENIAINF